jgi:DNA-directed RNA polymerase subunit RPC12/RpoP
VREHRCEYCGGLFMVYQKPSRPRRFCSVSCARRYTIMKRRTEHGETAENQEAAARQN